DGGRSAGQADHRRRNVAVGIGAVSDLSEIVVGPAARCTMGDRAAVTAAGGDGLHAAAQTDDGHGDPAFVAAAIAKLAVDVVAPATHRATGQAGAAVAGAGADAHHVTQRCRTAAVDRPGFE